MPAALLWAYSEEISFYIGVWSVLRDAPNAFLRVGAGMKNSICRIDLFGEKTVPENPQIFRDCNLKNTFPLFMPRAKRRAFKSVA